jgi:tetratricopeptide (TPR) repeat protein
MLASASVSIAHSQGGGFTVLGMVNLPGGGPASRVIVKISSLAGFNREVISDDQGRYQFLAIPGGRYRITVTDPQNPSHFLDPTEADTSRSSGNRLIVHLYLRIAPLTKDKNAKPGTVSAAEASQVVPKDAKKAFDEGLKRKADKQVDKALSSFNRAVQIYPAYFQAFSERGELRIATSRIPEAILDFEQALTLNEDYEPALRGLGYCKLEQQQFAEAIGYLERAITKAPDNANSHLFLGIANLALDRRDTARASLLEALKIDKGRAVTAHMYLADVYARSGKFKEAADELRTYLSAKPEAPNAARLRAKEAELRERAKKQ